jgi:hypothetical protein
MLLAFEEITMERMAKTNEEFVARFQDRIDELKDSLACPATPGRQ